MREGAKGKLCHSIPTLYKLYSFLCSKAPFLRSGREVQPSSVILGSRPIRPLSKSDLGKRDQCSQSFDVLE